jgi:hypothetical protein
MKHLALRWRHHTSKMLVPLYHVTQCHISQNNDLAVMFIAPRSNTVSHLMDCNIFCSVQNIPTSSGKSSEATSGGGPSSITPTKQKIQIHKLHIHQALYHISHTPMTDVFQLSGHFHLYYCIIFYTNYLPIIFVYY